MFSGKVPEVSHLRIFGCPVYIHIPKDIRTKLDPSGKKGIFVRYIETSKAYRVYVPGYKMIDISKDVIFDEDAAFYKSKRNHVDEVHDEEPTASTIPYTEEEELVPENHDMMEPQKPVDSPTEVITYQRKPGWAHELIQYAERYGAPNKTFRESKIPRLYSNYVALASNIIDAEPSSYEEVAEKKVWQDAMIEEYQSIMKNDVWDIVPRPKEKSVVTSKWLYKIKHAVDGSIEKYNARFVARGFSQKEGIDYEETFALVVRYTSIRATIAIVAKMGWKLHQMDTKTAFLNGVIEEEVYVEKPQGFETHDSQPHVC